METLKTSWRTAAVDTPVANAISNVDTLHWLKTAETAAVDVPVINIILNTNTDRVRINIVSGTFTGHYQHLLETSRWDS